MRRGAAAAVALLGLLGAALSCDKPTAPARGDLSLEVRGLPATVPFRVVLIGPRGDSIAVTGNGLLQDLPAGTYQVRPSDPDISPDDVASPSDTTIRVTKDKTAYIILRYSYLTGGANIGAYGLPEGDTALLQVRAPDNSLTSLRIPGRHRGLQPGVWRVLQDPYRKNGDVYAFPPAGTFTIEAGPQETSFALTYSLASAKLNVRFVNYPAGVPKRATVIHGFYPDTARLFGDTLLTGLRPTWAYLRGGYVDAGPYRYASFTDAVVEYTASTTPRDVEVRYGYASGAMRITTTGLPPGVVPQVQLTGWATNRRITLGTDTVPFLMPGGYAIEPIAFTADGAFFDALPVTDIRIASESLTTVALDYRDGASTFDARIERVTVSQAIQTMANSVPLLAGRPALVRVLALADRANTLRPRVRIRVADGATTLIDTIVTGRFPDGIPTARPDGDWASATLALPGEFLRPGMRVVAFLDPDDAFTDLDPVNDHWPRDTTEGTLAIRDVPPLSVRFVPVRFSTSPSEVSIPSTVASALLEETYRLHPLQQVAFDVGAEYVTSQPRPGSLDGAVWTNIIGELEALRVLEGGDRHYLGVMHVNYSSGIAGVGYIGGRTTLIWDDLGSANAVLAHELGHNFGRYHAPCGNPGGVDFNFPRGDGSIGDLGWNPGSTTSVAASTPDLMSYCEPAWTSAYTYTGVLARRDAVAAAERPAVAGDVLLVSGSITNGVVSLDPAFVTAGAAALPGTGPHRLELRDASGATILEAAFSSAEVAEATAGVEHFTLAIPVERFAGRVPASLAVTVAGRRAELRAGPALLQSGAGAVAASTRTDGQVAIGWTGTTAARGLIVRDRETGRIITIARRADAVVPFRAAGYDVTVSDGLQSVTQRVRPAPR